MNEKLNFLCKEITKFICGKCIHKDYDTCKECKFFKLINEIYSLGDQCSINLEIPYLAGLIDGEGCITICFRREFLNLEPRISIVNTSGDIIKWARDVLGCGKISHRAQHNLNRKDSYCLTITGNKNIKEILLEIIPYLKIKKHIASLVLEFCNYRSNLKGRKGSGKRKYTEKEINLAKQVRALNKRGKS